MWRNLKINSIVFNLKLVPQICFQNDIFPIYKINNEILRNFNLKDCTLFYEKIAKELDKEKDLKSYEFILFVSYSSYSKF